MDLLVSEATTLPTDLQSLIAVQYKMLKTVWKESDSTILLLLKQS